MTSAKIASILKEWGGHAAVAMVRLKALAPYALIELILPGGSVMALLLWIYRRRKAQAGAWQWHPSAVVSAIKQGWERVFLTGRMALATYRNRLRQATHQKLKPCAAGVSYRLTP